VANETIKGLETDINNLNNMLNRNKDEMSIVQNNLLNESNSLSQLIQDNTHLNELVENKNNQIKNINNENDILKQNNTEINCNNMKMNNLIQAYKKHLLLLICQNKKLAAEIQLLLGRDEELRKILERDNHLQETKFENENIVNNSLQKIQQSPDQVIKNSSLKQTHSFGRNENGEESNLNNIKSMNNVNMSLSGSGMNLGMSGNSNLAGTKINQEKDLKTSQENNEEQGQGEEDMINMEGNEEQNN
jgi:hypothetical protein